METYKFFSKGLLIIAAVLVLMACNDNETGNKGKLNLYLTDAPADDSNLIGVYISIARVEVNGVGGWSTVAEYETPKKINLLDFQNGDSFFLGDAELNAGSYKEVRLILNIADESETARVINPSSYLEYANGSVEPLFVPSGSQSGYKVKGDFEISSNNTSNVILDFDVRKAVVKAGSSGKYILKPTIRLVLNENIGTIEGSIDLEENPEGQNLVVFAYQAGTFTEEELNATSEDNAFLNAVSSAAIDTNGNFKLAFLNQGTYDLYVVHVGSESNVVVATLSNVEVNALSTTTVTINN